MGRRGPPATPDKLRVLRNNPGKRKPRAAPKAEAKAPPCPAWLPADAKAEWKRLAPMLVELGRLTPADQAMLTDLCLALAELKLATETLEREGRFYDLPNGTKAKHPAIGSQRDAMTKVRQFAAEFGLSPASRTRMSIKPDDDKDDDPLAALLRRQAEARGKPAAG